METDMSFGATAGSYLHSLQILDYVRSEPHKRAIEVKQWWVCHTSGKDARMLRTEANICLGAHAKPKRNAGASEQHGNIPCIIPRDVRETAVETEEPEWIRRR